MATAARFLGSIGVSLAAIVTGLAVSILGCTQGAGTVGDSPPPASAASKPAAGSTVADAPSRAGGVVIAQLITHDSKVAILSGGKDKDLRVVVRRMDGAIVADGITLSELRVRQPELYEMVTSAFASAGGQHGYLDASLHLNMK